MQRIIVIACLLFGLLGCKSEIEKDCEKKIEGLASVFGKADMEKSDWPEKKATAVKKCIENGGELKIGR